MVFLIAQLLIIGMPFICHFGFGDCFLFAICLCLQILKTQIQILNPSWRLIHESKEDNTKTVY